MFRCMENLTSVGNRLGIIHMTKNHFHVPSLRLFVEKRPESASDQTNGRQKTSNKPNLRNAGTGYNSNAATVVVMMALGLLAMYPMVFRPMFFSEDLGDKQSKILEKAGINPAQSRPNFMPEWSNPFEPIDKSDRR